jgi:hypothetical protein
MTMPTLNAICQAVQDIVGALTGIRMAPDVPGEQTSMSDVTAFCYPGTGRFELADTGGRGLAEHTLHLVIITPRKHLRTDYARVSGLGDTVARALLAAPTLAGTVLNVNRVGYTFGALEWGGQTELGWSFDLDVLTAGSLT